MSHHNAFSIQEKAPFLTPIWNLTFPGAPPLRVDLESKIFLGEGEGGPPLTLSGEEKRREEKVVENFGIPEQKNA